METRFNLVIGKVLSDPVWIEEAFRYLPLGPTLQDIVLSHGRRIYTQDQGRLVLRWNNEPFGSSDAENYVFLPLRNCKIVTRELDRLISIASDTALALPCVRSKPLKAQSTQPPISLSRLPNGSACQTSPPPAFILFFYSREKSVPTPFKIKPNCPTYIRKISLNSYMQLFSFFKKVAW